MRDQLEANEMRLCVDGDMWLLQEGIRSVLGRELPEALAIGPEEKDSLTPTLLILCASDPPKILPLLGDYRKRFPEIKTILLYQMCPGENLLTYLSLGCCCVHQATLSGEELIQCIRMVENNFCLWDKEVIRLVLQDVQRYHGFVACMQNEIKPCVPTPRELDIAEGILEGLNNDGLAKRLYLSSGTVKNIIAGILDKYGFQNRAQIISLLALK